MGPCGLLMFAISIFRRNTSLPSFETFSWFYAIRTISECANILLEKIIFLLIFLTWILNVLPVFAHVVLVAVYLQIVITMGWSL